MGRSVSSGQRAGPVRPGEGGFLPWGGGSQTGLCGGKREGGQRMVTAGQFIFQRACEGKEKEVTRGGVGLEGSLFQDGGICAREEGRPVAWVGQWGWSLK